MRTTLVRTAPREAFKQVQLLPELPQVPGFATGVASARAVMLHPLALRCVPGREIRPGSNSPALPTNLRAPQS